MWPEGPEVVTSVFRSMVHLPAFWKKGVFGVPTFSFHRASDPSVELAPCFSASAAWPEVGGGWTFPRAGPSEFDLGGVSDLESGLQVSGPSGDLAACACGSNPVPASSAEGEAGASRVVIRRETGARGVDTGQPAVSSFLQQTPKMLTV